MKQKSVAVIGILLLAILSFAPIFISHILNQQNLESIRKATSNESQKLAVLRRVQKRISIPNEPPEMITIVDKENLKDLTFYNVLQNGNKMLIFPKSKIGIIYDLDVDAVFGVISLPHPNPLLKGEGKHL